MSALKDVIYLSNTDFETLVTNGTVTINGTTLTYDENSLYITPDEANGTVTSVGISVPTGLSVSGSPITNSGTIAISLASGYSIPTTAKQTSWDSKYTKPSTGIPASDLAESYYLASNPNGYTTNKGTVTSVSAGTGLSISGTSTVNPTVNIASGYKLPTTTEWSGMAELANGKTKTYATTLVNTGNDIFFPIGSTVLSGVVAKTSLNSACSTADIQMGTSGFDYIDLEQLVGRDWYDDYYLYIWHTVDSTTCSVTSISLGNLNVGDIILLTDLNYPDYWIDDNGGILYKMETTKVDLTDYVTTNTEQTISGTKTFTSTNSYISGCGFSKSDNLLSDTNPAAMRGLASNPFFGLRCNNTNYYLQATSSGLYLGPTSTVATSWDASGNITIRGTTQPKWGTKTLATTDQLSSYVPTSRTINGKALSSDITLSASDVSALSSNTTYVVSAGSNGNTLTITSSTGSSLTYTPTIPTHYEHNIRVYYSTGNFSVTFKFIDTNSAAYTYSTLTKALYDRGFASSTTVCSANGVYGTSSAQNLILGVYGYNSSSAYRLYFRYLPLVSYSSSTATINNTVSGETTTYLTLTSSYTIQDKVRTL